MDFVRIQKSKYNVIECFADSAEQVLIRGFRNACAKEEIAIEIKDAIRVLLLIELDFILCCMVQVDIKF